MVDDSLQTFTDNMAGVIDWAAIKRYYSGNCELDTLDQTLFIQVFSDLFNEPINE